MKSIHEYFNNKTNKDNNVANANSSYNLQKFRNEFVIFLRPTWQMDG